MSTPDKQKAKKRKNRRAAKSLASPATTSPAQNSPAVTTSEQELADIQRLMDIPTYIDEGGSVPEPTPFSRGPTPYLGGERCLLCKCERPDPPQAQQEAKSEDGESSPKMSTSPGSLSQLPLWLCPGCRKAVEEEQKKPAYEAPLLEQRLEPSLRFLPELAGEFTSNNSVCTCEACTERRQIEAEHEKETQELQQCWMELRHVVRCIYREAGTGLAADTQDEETSPQRDTEKIKELVHRLCARDAHQLYQRLESQGREYVIEMKVRLFKQLTSGHKTPVQAKQFVSMLLEEYSNLCAAAKSLASFLGELETKHLKRFNLTWELHNKHLFQSIIYSDPFVQNSLPMLIAQLRSGAASKESYHEDTYPNILHRYLKFDDEMSVISVVWRDCQQLLETYNDEQAALRAKQKMLKDDWEFFKAQRRHVEQQVLKKSPTSSVTHNLEAQFTETMRHILHGTKATPEDCQCSNCNKKRYDNNWLLPQRCACSTSSSSKHPCEECTLSHLIKCGIITPDGNPDQFQLQQQLQQHQQHYDTPHNVSTANTTAVSSTNCFSVEGSPYMIDVTPPSMSSTNSSSGSSSPINVDPKRLVLPFDVCPESFELAEDEIPEEIEDDDESLSDSDRGDGDDNEADDEAGDGSFTATTEYQSAEEGLELTSVMDNGQENNDTSCGEGVADYTSLESGAPVLGLPTVTADAVKNDCGCTHCTRARLDQQRQAEELINPCQCHACMVQSGKNVPTCLPHVPTPPRAAAFHLYPHIHGSNCLQTAVALHGHNPHVGPVLQSHLYEYEVHSPTSTTRQPKSLLNPQKKHNANFSLDLESHEALHEHIYHAYGEWDNAYDSSKLMLSSQKYVGSELLPPPPLINGSPFVNVGDQLSTEAALSLASAMQTSVYQNNTVAMNSPHTSLATSTSFANTSVASSNGDHIHTEACFKSMKPGGHNILSTSQPLSTVASRSVTSGCGAVPSTAASAAVATSNPVILTSSAAATSPSTAGATSSHNDHCLKLNPFLHTHHASFTSTHATTTISPSPPLPSHQLPVKLTSELIRSAAINAVKEESARNNNPGSALSMPHTCSHQHNPVINPQLATNGNQPFMPPNTGLGAGLPTLNNITVSLPTQSVCNDPDCDGHHDAEYDSIDDSCSEQSSSTSTSNQKDGKYCNCCYCEFFGHSNPTQPPTSRIRDRLRLRLKKKGEQKTEEPRQPPPPPPKDELVDDRGLEELVRFINGEEKENKSASAKAAKRARQKQKKAEERAKREAEMKAALERERRHQEHRRAIAKVMEDAAKQQQHRIQQQRKEEAAKKKKLKMKEINKINDENQNPCSANALSQHQPAEECSAHSLHPSGKTGTKGTKSLSKRGEADGCQTPSNASSAPRDPSLSVSAASASKASAGQPTSSSSSRSGSKGESKVEKTKRGKGSTPSPTATPSNPVVTTLKQASAPSNQNQYQNARIVKTPTHNYQQPVAPQNSQQQQRGRINNKGNDSPSQKCSSSSHASGDNNRKTFDNNSYQGNQGSPPNTAHHQNIKQQQILNNNNNPKKGEKSNSVNGTQTPPAPNTPIQQRRCNNSQSLTSGCSSRGGPSRPMATGPPLPPDRVGRGDGSPCPMVNGNVSNVQEASHKKSDTKILKVSQQAQSNTPKLKVEEKAPKQSDQPSNVPSAKPKKNKRKNKSAEDLDEIFMPRDLDPDNGEIDELDREIEEFKRFCLDSTPMPKQEKLQVNMNLKDIFNKKKSGVSCA